MNRRLVVLVAGLAAVGALALGGVAVAGSAGVFDDDQLTGPSADRAKAAALKSTGGGTANEVERDSEKGATYEVEVTRPDGSTVDVRLDASFNVVGTESESKEDDGLEQEGEHQD